jgi:hypothetical protein
LRTSFARLGQHAAAEDRVRIGGARLVEKSELLSERARDAIELLLGDRDAAVPSFAGARRPQLV